MEILIKNITATDTFEVRHPVLRADKPIESCVFDGDLLPSTVHFGCYITNQLCGVVSLFQSNHQNWSAPFSYQIRGMAVLDSFQKKGLGQALILAAEDYCKQEKASIIWFNARITAIAFYTKMGYETKGTIFEISGVGPHIVMFKKID